MVHSNYIGRFGNNIFQHIFARIIAEHFGYELINSPEKFEHQEHFKNIVKVPGKTMSGAGVVYDGTNSPFITLNEILLDKMPRKIILNGFWQKYEFYKPYQDKIKEWLELPASEYADQIGEMDVVLHFRRDDYLEAKSNLSFEYYDKILNNNEFENVYLTGDVDNHVLDHFGKIAKHFRINVIEDFKFIKAFNNIIMSNSSFVWWAAFLSVAERIWYPEPNSGYWSLSQNQRLFIPERMEKVKTWIGNV